MKIKQLTMSRKFTILSLFSICLLLKSSILLATDVGTGKTYTTLRSAFDAINNGTLTGAVLLEITSNLTETQSAKLNASGEGSASYTSVTIRPKGGAWVISGSFSNGSTLATALENLSAIIHLKGADNVTVDGRIGGTGSTNSLTIANTATATSYKFAVRLTGDASNNIFKYCTFKSKNTTTSYNACGMFIQALPGTNGNDNNTVDHCLFDGEEGAGRIGFHAYSLTDDNITVSNNEYKNIGVSCIYPYNAGNNLVISGNSSYWTAGSTSGTGILPQIMIGTIANGDITGNYIGGSAPQCGGTAAVLTTGTSSFAPITLSGSCSGVLNIQGNRITNLDITATTGSTSGGVFTGIFILNNTSTTGTVNIGTTTENIIGGTTGTGSIIIRTTASSASNNLNVSGIRNQGSQSPVNIQNNIIGSIKIEAPVNSSLVYVNFYGIHNAKEKSSISNNIIGSTTTSNSIENLSGSTQATTVFGNYGIYSTYTAGANATVISGNTISNLYMNSASSKAVTSGVYASGFSGGNITVSGNTIRDISTNSTNTGTGTAGALHGIIGNQIGTVSGNKIYNLYQLEATEAVYASGITWIAGTNNIIEKNYIHHLSVASPAASLQGITGGIASLILRNNIIHLGLKPDGTSITEGAKINGLNLGGVHEVYYNSIYIGGENVVAALPTAVIHTSAASANIKYMNNILVNNRSNISGSARNMIFSSSVTPDAATVSNYNMFENKGTGFFFAADASKDYPVFSAWKSAGFDANSGETNPMFANVTGNSATVNMQLQSSNPIESRGVVIASATEDYYGNTRNASATDIGAIEGNFVQTNPDMHPPVVSFTDIPDQPLSAMITLSDFAVATDDNAVATGASLPRLYYKRSTNDNAFTGNTASDNGWKYVVASNTSSPFSFELDMSLIQGGAVANGDVIEYFVAVQDNANHLTAYPAIAGAGMYPPVQNINFSTSSTLKSFTVTGALPVKLVSFTGNALSGLNRLTWVTSSEENNSHYDLERSSDGKKFNVITTIKGAHTTALQQEYQYDDRKPLSGLNYYRLKQVDTDGRFTLSATVLIRRSLENPEVVVLPNPATNFLKISAPARWSNAKITLFSINGQKVIQKTDVSGNDFTLDVSGCPKGMYVLEIREGAAVILTRKIMKD